MPTKERYSNMSKEQRDKQRAYNLKWNRENKDKCREWAKKYAETHKEERKQYEQKIKAELPIRTQCFMCRELATKRHKNMPICEDCDIKLREHKAHDNKNTIS